MTRAWIWLAAAACARGGSGTEDGSTGNVDAQIVTTIDAPGCGALPCDALYVSRSGSDTAAGTKQAPMKSIAAAVIKASQSAPALAVFVQGGAYPEQVLMRAGVGVYGGFDETWTRN